MADETPVDDMPDVSLMDNDIAQPIEATPSETPAEQATQEGADTKEQPQEGEDNAPEGEQPPTQEEEAQQPQDDEAAIRARNEAYAQRRIQERQRTRQNVAQQIDQAYGPKTEEDLVQEGYDPAQAQIEALRQEMQYERQKTQIAELNAGLQAEAVNVTHDFPLFDQNSKEFDAEFAKEVEESYRIASRLQVDENGIVVNAEVPLYDYYQRMATIYNRGTSRGQQQGQQEYQQMLARTENPGGSSSTSSGDSLDELEARLADVVIS
jgi:hypothetical protein